MDMFTYLIKVNMAIAIFYMVYHTCYRKDTFFSLRRYLLLSMFGLSVSYPFVDFSQWFVSQQPLREAAATYIQYLPEFTAVTENATTNTYSLTNYLFWGYLIVTSFFLLRLFIKIVQVVWIRVHASQIKIEEISVFQLRTETTPFSFFHWIFINPEMHKTKEIHEIITHELVHTKQRHSLDILFAEILCAFCWFNPLAWKLKSEIHKNLEFIVDHQVIKTGIDAQSYQYHLLRLAYHPSKATIVNQFNVSPLKERIMMLNTKQSPKMKLTTYTLVLPLLLLFVTANNAGAIVSSLSAKSKLQTVVDKVAEFIVDAADSPIHSDDLLSGTNTPTSTLIAQDGFEISGTIVDNNNQKPIQGVNIVNYRTSNGTISDVNGNFRLKAQEEDSLFLSYIGYKEITLAVKNKNSHVGTLRLKRKQEELNEVVVVAYGKKSNTNEAPQQTTTKKKEVFTVVEEMPEFPGGENALMQYIAQTIKYPATAQQSGIQGRIICTFTINADGSIIDAKINKGVDPSLDSEALRIIHAMPKWKPGKQRGKPVAVEYSLPINFRLQN